MVVSNIFGKTIENISCHKDMRLVTNKNKYCKLVMKPNYKNDRTFSENLMGVEIVITKIKILKSNIKMIVQVKVDLSRLVMYEFYYDYMVNKYGEELKLCYTKEEYQSGC